MSRVELTDKTISRLPFASTEAEYIVRDDVVPGLFVRIRRQTKTWTAQADQTIGGRRKTVREALGPTSELTVAAARRKARAILAAIKSKDRRAAEKARKSLTLDDAWTAYRERCIKRGRQPGTIQHYEELLRGPLKRFIDVPLAELGHNADLVVRMHEDVTRRSGPYRANAAARVLSAVYRYARKRLDRSLPESPTTAIEMNAESKSTGGFGLDDRLVSWADQLEKLPPIRREFALLTLLSGSRPDALSRAEWQHVDWHKRTLFVPNPKGGPKRAFHVPLSRDMIRSLVRLRRLRAFLFPGNQFVFPARSHDGRLSSWSEPRSRLSAYGRDLRRSYRTVCAQLGIPRIISMTLMNHISGADVHDGYIEKGALSGDTAKAQERISKAIIQKAFGDNKRLNAWRVV
jgi:integrase